GRRSAASSRAAWAAKAATRRCASSRSPGRCASSTRRRYREEQLTGNAMNASQRELVDVLRAAKELLALPGNDFAWSCWETAEVAVQEFDELIRAIEAGTPPSRKDLAILFAPTGPIQEVSLSSGWGLEFLTLSERFDAALVRGYGSDN